MQSRLQNDLSNCVGSAIGRMFKWLSTSRRMTIAAVYHQDCLDLARICLIRAKGYRSDMFFSEKLKSCVYIAYEKFRV